MARRPPASEEEARRDIAAVDAFLAQGFPAVSPSGDTRTRSAARKAAESCGVDRMTFLARVGTPEAPGSHFHRFGLRPDWGLAAARGELGFEPVLPGFAVSSTSTQRGADGATEREWIRTRRAPSVAPHAIPAGHVVKGESALLDAQGRVVAKWVKTRLDAGAVDLVEAIKSAFEEYRGRSPLIPPPAQTIADLLSVYVITDVHHGLLAWGKECGEDYDIQIGSDRLRSCMRDLVAQAQPSEEALILNLGDYFHNNDQRNVTPMSGHQLDVDSRFFKVAVTGVALHQDIIDLALQKHARVRVRVLPGNHDPQSSITLQVALAAFYANNPRVIVELDPSELFFLRFGATLIGACHGHNLRPEKMAMTMAMMRPTDWGASLFRWFLFGHIHHETLKEVGNVRCESFETIAAKDAYAASHGYLAGHSLNCVTLHRERGEIGRHRVNVVPALVAAA